MKELNVNSKPSGLFTKWITVVSLSLALQGKSACGNPRGTAGHMVSRMENKQFQTTLDNTKDISLPDEENHNTLYVAVTYNELVKVKTILNRYNEDMASGFPHKNPGFINARDPKYHNTPLEVTITQGNDSLFNLLIHNQYIDITTIDPMDNTALHLAIKNKRANIAKELINRFKTEHPDLLSVPDKEGNTPLHLAMACKLLDVQELLIKWVSKDKEKLWIKNKKGKTAVDIAIKNNQEHGILLVKEFPLQVLYTTNKKGETLLHKAAHKNQLDVFRLLLDRISQLAGKDEVIKQLASKNQNGKSVWQSIYLSQLSIGPLWSSTNMKMFQYAISSVRDNLKTADRHAILEDINRHECTIRPKGGISKEYADALRKMVG